MLKLWLQLVSDGVKRRDDPADAISSGTVDHGTVIRGSYMGGFGFPAGLTSVAILGGVAAVLSRIWVRPAGLVLWLILMALVVGTIIGVEVIYRRSFLEVRDGQIRWSVRQPPRQGEESMGSLRSVTIHRSGALLDFTGGAGGVMLDIADFRRRDIIRIVDALRLSGVRVDDSSGPISSFIDALLGRNRRDRL